MSDQRRIAGVELPLFALLNALKQENGGAWAEGQWQACRALLKDGVTLDATLQAVEAFHQSEVMQPLRNFETWLMANTADQADLTIGTSDDIVRQHKGSKALITDLLSTLVVESTGNLMSHGMSASQGPVLWLHHNIIAQQLYQAHV